jgi:ABC-type spermidine/putrescine transport system permease subunit I
MRRGSLVPWALLAPAILVYAVLFLWPQLDLLTLSVTRPPPFTLQHYARFLFDSYYLGVLGRTLAMGVAVTLVTLIFGFPLAFFLARLQSRWAPLLLMMTTFPLLVSAVVRSFGWMVLFFRNGAVSQALQALGLAGGPVQLMYTATGIVIALAQVLLPLMVLTLYAVLRSIDPALEDAAMGLGASPGRAVWRITLRLARGGILAGSLLVFSLAISAFATPSLVGGARAQVMATTIYEQTLELLDWPFAAALAAVLLAVVLMLSLCYARLVEPTRMPAP